jgi:hypothetical protein
MIRVLVTAATAILLLQGAAAWAQADQPAPAPEPPAVAPAPPAPAPPPAPPAPPPPSPRAVDGESPARSAPPAAPAAPAPDGSPVVRAKAGNLGFFFKLGGLATLDHNNTSRTVNALGFTQVGLKLVPSDNLLVRLYFGTGLQHSQTSCPEFGTCTAESSTDMGLEVGTTLEYHFRVWRRISPFVGAGLGLGYVNPSGGNNWNVGVGLGPLLGVEYYLGDRFSLTAEYMLTFELGYQKSETGSGAASVTTFAYRTLAGGALVVTYYF